MRTPMARVQARAQTPHDGLRLPQAGLICPRRTRRFSPGNSRGPRCSSPTTAPRRWRRHDVMRVARDRGAYLLETAARPTLSFSRALREPRVPHGVAVSLVRGHVLASEVALVLSDGRW